MSGKVVFKPYEPDQATFLPYSLEELVRLGHPFRIVKQVVDQVDVKPINKYKRGGASSFHPPISNQGTPRWSGPAKCMKLHQEEIMVLNPLKRMRLMLLSRI